jgi:hypothetical protein
VVRFCSLVRTQSSFARHQEAVTPAVVMSAILAPFDCGILWLGRSGVNNFFTDVENSERGGLGHFWGNGSARSQPDGFVVRGIASFLGLITLRRINAGINGVATKGGFLGTLALRCPNAVSTNHSHPSCLFMHLPFPARLSLTGCRRPALLPTPVNMAGLVVCKMNKP